MRRVQFPQLLTMSRDEVAAFVAGAHDVCISINCTRGELATVSPNFRAVLRLRFDDIPWKDTPAGAVQIDPAMAERAVRFVAANTDATRLVVHCAAGASRSVSMAMALAKCFTGRDWRPTWLRGRRGNELLRGRPAPNPNVYRAICDAYRLAWRLGRIKEMAHAQ